MLDLRIPWRKLALLALDAVLLSAGYVFAYWLRLGDDFWKSHGKTILQTLPILVGISLLIHMRMGLLDSILRYASIDTAVAVVKSVLFSVGLSALLLFLVFRLENLPRTTFVIYAMVAMLLVGASRMVARVFRRGPGDDATRVVLYGAGDTADLVIRGLRDLNYLAVALLDGNPASRGKRIHHLEIRGVEALPEVAKTAQELWVCEPGIVGEELRRLYEGAPGLRVKILPKLGSILLGTDLSKFHDPDIADLLRRPPRRLDRDRMREWLKGRRVLITGAGGSIGSEMARQVAQFGPASIALCDFSEAALFEIHRQVREGRPYLVDVRDAAAVQAMFEEARPEIVFHGAAYKHVPLVEDNPCQGILTNVVGLANVARAAVQGGVKEFVFISTDKAVRPVSVMGATKRAGEEIVRVLNKPGPTRFVAVRFGNVLGSSGSVVPIFQDQIRKGGPVTVTHPEMTRYFMLISEAVELVIQAGAIGRGGEVFVLDMGTPVRILDMAKDLIRLMGSEARIEITGTRPGEKIHEEVLISKDSSPTPFPDIWVDAEPAPGTDWRLLEAEVEGLAEAARAGDARRALSLLARLVPEFAPVHEGTRRLIEKIPVP